MRFDLILATLCAIQSVVLIAVSLKALKLVRLMRRRERYNAGLMREAARQLTTYHARVCVLETALRKFGVPCAAGGDYCALCTPLILGQQGGAECRPADEPCPTIATKGAIRVITPFVFDNANRGTLCGIGPLNTITTKDNHMACFPHLDDGRLVDVRIRMLKPSELAAAHSFPPDYELTGTRGDMVKQIGNSVPVRTASAMCSTDIDELIGR